MQPEILNLLPARLFMAKASRLAAGKWSAKAMRSDYWRLYNNRDDGAYITVDGRRIDLRRGASFVIPRDMTFAFYNERDVRHMFLHFDAPGVEVDGVVQLDADAPVDALARRLHQDLTLRPDGPGARSRATALLFAALAQMLDSGAARPATTDPTLSPALGYIDAHLHEPVRNRTLALLCHLSEDYFIRRFREDLGMTPANYIRRRRVTEAAYRLLHTSSSVESIARDLGFGTRACFDRTFRLLTGTTPAAYRRTTPRA